MIENGLYDLIVADPTIVNLINGLGGVITESVKFNLLSKSVPQLPAIVMERIHSQSPSTLDGQAALTDATYSVDTYANELLDARKVANAIENLFQDFDGTLTDGSEVHVYQTTSRDLQYQAGGNTGWLFRVRVEVHMFFLEPA